MKKIIIIAAHKSIPATQQNAHNTMADIFLHNFSNEKNVC